VVKRRRGFRPEAAWLGARAFRLLWGADDARDLRPLLATSVLTSLAFSTFWSYSGVFAVKHLGASVSQVGVMYLVGSALVAASSYATGQLSHRIGRKGLIVLAIVAESVVIAALAALDGGVEVGFVLIWLTGIVGSPA